MTVEISGLITSTTYASPLEVSRGGRALLGALLHVGVTAECQDQTVEPGFG